MIRITLHEEQFRELVAGRVASGYAQLGADSIPFEAILADIGFAAMVDALNAASVERHRPTLPPMPVGACVPCWRDIYGESFSPALAEADPRRFTVRDLDRLVVHRRVMFDDHVVGAVCGDIYTQAGVLVELVKVASAKDA